MMIIFCALVYLAAASPAALRSGSIYRKLSTIAPGNILPSFLFMQGAEEGGSLALPLGGGRGTPQPYQPDDSCDDDIFTNEMPDLRSPQLPYLTQDQWGCELLNGSLDTLFLEDEYLQVRITPGFAGKVWGITDKVTKREMLFDNPSHQPANIGALHAWASGGSEWNYSPGIIGHSAFTETGSWVGRIDTPRGPIVRVYDFDRYNHTTWSVDMFLANGTFWAHPRITNNNVEDLQGYWWTCVAHHVTPASRVLTPAHRVVQTSAGASQCNAWPHFTSGFRNDTFSGLNATYGVDNSYLGNVEPPGDFFVRIQQPVRPYIAHAEADGYTVMHGHPLNGTKFFTWGQNGPGRFMQDFLSGFPGDRSGDYAELQIGPAATQMNTFPLPAGKDFEWTEWFIAFQGNASTLHSADYSEAVGVTDAKYLSDSAVSDMNAFFATYADTDPTVLLRSGTDWASVEEARRDSRLRKGLVFSPSSDTADSAPWRELLRDGVFSNATLKLLPTSYMVHDVWLAMLEASLVKHGASYLTLLHLAVNLIERGDVTRSSLLLSQSLSLQENPVTLRCMGALQTNSKDAATYYWLAWDLAVSPVYGSDPSQQRLALNLGAEMFTLFIGEGMWDQAQELLAQAPSILLASDQALIASAYVAFYLNNDPTATMQVLQSNCFPTIASARGSLGDLWLKSVVLRQSQSLNRTLTPAEARHARLADPIPRNIGCTYGGAFCSSYW